MEKESRFVYSQNDTGLKVLSEEEIIEGLFGKSEKKKENNVIQKSIEFFGNIFKKNEYMPSTVKLLRVELDELNEEISKSESIEISKVFNSKQIGKVNAKKVYDLVLNKHKKYLILQKLVKDAYR